MRTCVRERHGAAAAGPLRAAASRDTAPRLACEVPIRPHLCSVLLRLGLAHWPLLPAPLHPPPHAQTAITWSTAAPQPRCSPATTAFACPSSMLKGTCWLHTKQQRTRGGWGKRARRLSIRCCCARASFARLARLRCRVTAVGDGWIELDCPLPIDLRLAWQVRVPCRGWDLGCRHVARCSNHTSPSISGAAAQMRAANAGAGGSCCCCRVPPAPRRRHRPRQPRPPPLLPRMQPAVFPYAPTVQHSGIEDLTFQFRWGEKPGSCVVLSCKGGEDPKP